jgi:Ca2+-binding RTX toxin-like protein
MPARRRSILRATELESRTVPAVLSYTAPLGNGPDVLVLRLDTSGTRVELTDNGLSIASRPVSSLSAIEITGAANENDTLVVDYTAGVFNVPVFYNGGAAGVDSLEVIGTTASSALYNPSATTPGSGSVAVGAATIQFADLSPVTVSRMASLVMTTPNGADVLTVDTPAAGRTRIGGTSGGVAMESLTFFEVGQVSLNAAANGVAVADTIAVAGPLAATGLQSFAVVLGTGNNTLDFGASPQSITADIGTNVTTVAFAGAGTVPVIATGTVATLIGTSGNDTYVDHTTIEALSLIDGGGDNLFVLDPSSSVDITATGGGSNTLDFSTSTDPIVATVGTTDTTVSEVGDDGTVSFTGTTDATVTTVIGTTGGDTFIDESATSLITLEGGAGDDLYDLQPGSSIVVVEEANGGNDTFSFGRALYHINANLQTGLITDEKFNEVLIQDRQGTRRGHVENLRGTDFSDAIRGTDGDNVLFGGSGNDVIDGGGGNDTYVMLPGGNDVVIDGGGTDTLDYSGSNSGTGITLDLSRSNGSVQNIDSIGNTLALAGVIENVFGTRWADTLSGGSNDNFLAGLGGNDRLMGQSGNDVLLGGSGDDDLVGGSDRDIVVGGLGADRLNAGAGQDILIAGYTAYDAVGSIDAVNASAWNAIRSAWIGSGLIGERVAAIRAGVGPLNAFRLIAGEGGTVVNDDGATDVLTGGQAADWFFALLPPDVITDKDDSEFIN